MQCCWRECTFPSFRPAQFCVGGYPGSRSAFSSPLTRNAWQRRGVRSRMTRITARPRETLFGYYGEPATRRFKIMARRDHWKYIWFANGDREQLFDLAKDPLEHSNLIESQRDVARKLKDAAAAACKRPELRAVLDGNGLRGFSFEARPRSAFINSTTRAELLDFPSGHRRY